jgi:hypothetical protein
MGIRLESPETIQWARVTGGEGGSHPSNILDNGYAAGTININGNTPVILAQDGPDMGGYICACTVASAEMYIAIFHHLQDITDVCSPGGNSDNSTLDAQLNLGEFPGLILNA